MYQNLNLLIFDYILNNTPIEVVNTIFFGLAKKILNTIAFHYLGGSTYSTPFWEYAKNWGNRTLKESPQFEQYIKEISTYTKSISGWFAVSSIPLQGSFLPYQMRTLSRNLEYNYL